MVTVWIETDQGHALSDSSVSRPNRNEDFYLYTQVVSTWWGHTKVCTPWTPPLDPPMHRTLYAESASPTPTCATKSEDSNLKLTVTGKQTASSFSVPRIPIYLDWILHDKQQCCWQSYIVRGQIKKLIPSICGFWAGTLAQKINITSFCSSSQWAPIIIVSLTMNIPTYLAVETQDRLGQFIKHSWHVCCAICWLHLFSGTAYVFLLPKLSWASKYFHI